MAIINHTFDIPGENLSYEFAARINVLPTWLEQITVKQEIIAWAKSLNIPCSVIGYSVFFHSEKDRLLFVLKFGYDQQ